MEKARGHTLESDLFTQVDTMEFMEREGDKEIVERLRPEQIQYAIIFTPLSDRGTPP